MMKQNLIVVSLAEVFKVVELANKGGNIELLRTIIRELPSNGITVEWLKEAVFEAGLRKQRVICLLPNDLAIFKTLTLPLIPTEQLAAAVQLEIENINGECYVKIVTQQIQAEMNLLKVAIVKKEKYLAHCELWQQAGVEFQWAGFSFRGIQNFLNFHKDFLDNQTETQIYLEGSSKQVSFGVITGETVLFKREFTPGIEELKEDRQEILDDFLEEVRLSIAAYRKLSSEESLPIKIWGFGNWSKVEFLQKKLQRELKLNWEIPERCRLTGKADPEAISQVAALIGLGLEELGWNTAESLRLYSQSRQNVINYLKFWQAASGWVIASCLIVTGILFWLQAGVIQHRKDTAWLAAQEDTLLKLRHTETVTRQKLSRLNTLKTWQVDNGRELEFLTVLEQNLPEGTVINNLTLESGTIKDLSGTTPAVSYLLNRLKKVPLLQDLKLKGTITVSPQGELFHLEGLIHEKVSK